MFDTAEAAVEGATAAGATFADARALEQQSERISVQNQEVEELDRTNQAGVGVRALIGSSWGFFATDDTSKARRAGERAAEIARASGAVPGDLMVLADVPTVEDTYVTPVEEDPFSVGTTEKVDLLAAVTQRATEVAEVRISQAILRFWQTDKYYVSSQGSRIHQGLTQSGGGFTATAVGEHEVQVRSYPQRAGQFESGGYEVIRRWDYLGQVDRIASEAAALLTADELGERNTNLVLEGSQVALQIHESVGHAVELDRILGWEAAFAGRSHLELPNLGAHRYGSHLMNVTADATLPGAVATFGYDDEGTPAQRVEIVRGGTWVGVLSGRDSAAIAGVSPGGMVRGDGYNRLPMVRMTNVGILPGDSSLEEMIADTKDGVYMATNRSWSIDDVRLNFQFGCEIGWEIKGGKLGRMVRNPTYTGITPVFWRNLDQLGDEAEWVHWGLASCGKGQPLQVASTAHSAPTARFANTRVGVKG